MIELPHLPIYKFQLFIQTSHSISSQSFIEATFRGGLGYILKEFYCPYAVKQAGAFPKSDCKLCQQKKDCLYPVLFDPIPGMGQENNSEDIPRPWSILASVEEENTIILEFTFFGENQDKIPRLVDALRMLGLQGIGKYKTRYQIQGISDIQRNYLDNYHSEAQGRSKETYDVMLDVISPMALRKQGRKLLQWDTDAFARATLRRIYLLSVHQNIPIPASWDYKVLLNLFAKISSESRESIYSRSRNSTRQKANIRYSGFVGKVLLHNVPKDAIPIIKAASLLGVGAGTVFGSGRIRIPGIF